ncbi:MAG: TrkA C-terminal domain-containing protein [Myxococcota bacterium]
MDINATELLKANPALVLFLVLGFGLMLGRIRLAGVEIGAVTGVLLVGLFIGHHGLDIPTSSQSLGFILFIYCVGMQAGPEVVRVFKQDGARYAVLSVVTAVSGLAIATAASQFFDFEFGVAAGALAGGLTSTPTLVAAQDALAQGAVVPAGMSHDDVLANISSAYALTYVFGMGGLVLMIAFLPKMLGIDLAAEAAELGLGQLDEDEDAPGELPVIRAYRVDHEEVTRVRYRDRDVTIPFEIQLIKRNGEVFAPEPDTRLELGDVVSVVALQSVHAGASDRLGAEVVDTDVLDRSMESRSIVISNSDIEGKTLHELDLARAYRCWLTEVNRIGIALPRRGDLDLHVGDRLMLTGSPTDLDDVAKRLGHQEASLHETDLLALAFGIALGIFFGTFTITLQSATVGLGTAGGVLLAGLLFGLMHSRRPTFGRLPAAARYIMMELGLLLFMADVAVSAGSSIVSTFQAVGPALIGTGIAVTTIPVLIAFGIGRVVFKMNAALLFGAVTGAMTSTAALQQIRTQANSAVPALGYVGTYSFANVLLALAGGIIMRA